MLNAHACVYGLCALWDSQVRLLSVYILLRHIATSGRSVKWLHRTMSMSPKQAVYPESYLSPGPGCTTTSQLTYCQGGRKPTSLVQLSPDALTSQIGWQLPPCNPPFRIVTCLMLSAMVASWRPTGANFGGGSDWDVVVQPSPVRTIPTLSSPRLSKYTITFGPDIPWQTKGSQWNMWLDNRKW